MSKINQGKILVWFNIARYYYSWITQTIAFLGILKLLGLSWIILSIIFLCLIPVICGIIYFHMKFVYPKEHQYIWTKNPAYKKLLKDLDNIDRKINNINKKINLIDLTERK